MKSLSEIEAEVARLAQIMGAPGNDLPTYGYPRDDASPHVEVDQKYHYVIVERGREAERKSTSDFEELLYWIFADLSHRLAFAFESRNRVDGPDFRRIAFSKQVELLGLISPRMAARRAMEIGKILASAPYRDESPPAMPAGLPGPLAMKLAFRIIPEDCAMLVAQATERRLRNHDRQTRQMARIVGGLLYALLAMVPIILAACFYSFDAAWTDLFGSVWVGPRGRTLAIALFTLAYWLLWWRSQEAWFASINAHLAGRGGRLVRGLLARMIHRSASASLERLEGLNHVFLDQEGFSSAGPSGGRTRRVSWRSVVRIVETSSFYKIYTATSQRFGLCYLVARGSDEMDFETYRAGLRFLLEMSPVKPVADLEGHAPASMRRSLVMAFLLSLLAFVAAYRLTEAVARYLTDMGHPMAAVFIGQFALFVPGFPCGIVAGYMATPKGFPVALVAGFLGALWTIGWTSEGAGHVIADSGLNAASTAGCLLGAAIASGVCAWSGERLQAAGAGERPCPARTSLR